MPSVTNIVFHPPFRATSADGVFSFPLSEPWYRSLPVSCIAGLEVRVNGEEIAPERIAIEIDGVRRSIAACADAVESYWFIQDSATVHIDGVQVGETAHVVAHLVTRIPYIMVSPTMALPHHTVQAETFEVVSA